MATFTVASGKRATYRESSATNNTYVINDDTKGATISGSVNGDIIAIEGFAGDFTASVRGRVVTLKSTVDTDVVVKFQLANTAGSTASVRFLDGDLTATFTAARKVTLGAQTLSSKAATVNDSALGANDSSSTFDESSGGSGTGTTFTLTTDSNVVAGTAGDDTIYGVIDDDTAANNTFTVLDAVSGGLGNDTLSLIADVSGAAIGLPATEISGVETISIRNVSGQTFTASMAAVTGENTVVNNLSTARTDFTNVKAGTTVKVNGNGVITNGATNATYVAGATSGTLTVNGGVTAGAIAVNGAGFTSLTINSTGDANTTGAISTTGTPTTTTINAATALTTAGLTVGTHATADQALVISGAAANVAATSTAAATAAVVLGALDADLDSVNASGLTAGGVSATLSATVAATFTGGAGSDTVTTSTTGQTGVVNAAGGNDTLVLANTVDIDTTTEGAKYTNFEVLQVQDGVTADLDNFTGSTITSINLNDAGNATVVSNLNATQAAAVNLIAYNGNLTIGVKDATNVGQLDTVTLNFNDGDTTASEAYGGGALTATIAGVETLNLSLTDDAAVTLAAARNAALNKVVVTGGGDLTLITGDTAGANFLIDASASTGTTNITAADFATNGVQIRGSSTKANTITGSAQSDIIVGGSAIDTVTNSAGTDTLNLGSDSVADIFDIANLLGKTTVTNFDAATSTTAEDILRISADTVDGNEIVITSAAAQQNLVDDRTYVIEQTVGTAGSLTTGGSATLTTANFTADTLTAVAAFLSERFVEAAANEDAIFIINNGTNSYVYAFNDDGVANTIDAGELVLVGVINNAIVLNGDVTQV